MADIGSLEPFLLISSLVFAVPSIALSSFVFYRIWTSAKYKTSRYLRLFTLKTANEANLYVFNLFCLHLPIISSMNSFYSGITNSLLIPICGFMLIVLMNSSFLYGISLSFNRYASMAKPTTFRKDNERSVFYTLLLIYPLPILFGVRVLVWKARMMEIKGQSGPIFIFFTPDMGALQTINDYAMFSYYAIACLIEFGLNAATLFTIVSKKVFTKSAAKRQQEIGLYVTTLCSFFVTILYTAAQTCIQFFPFSFAAFLAMKGQLIVVDIMALSNVYFLLAFSPALRKHIFGSEPTQEKSVVSHSAVSVKNK